MHNITLLDKLQLLLLPLPFPSLQSKCWVIQFIELTGCAIEISRYCQMMTISQHLAVRSTTKEIDAGDDSDSDSGPKQKALNHTIRINSY